MLGVLLLCAGLSVDVAAAAQFETRRGTIETGRASWYSLRGHETASGERFDPRAMTAAHRRHPFGTRLRVTNLENGKSVVVRVNDRGPYVRGRVLDLTRRAAERIGLKKDGTEKVQILPLR